MATIEVTLFQTICHCNWYAKEVNMVRVSNFIYCLNSVTSDAEANAFGVLSAITPDFVPGSFSFSVLCSILGLEDGNHSIKMQFIAPDGEILVNIDGIIPYERKTDNNLPAEQIGINISTVWQNVTFKQSGMYKTIVTVDNSECGTYEIFVKGKNEV